MKEIYSVNKGSYYFHLLVMTIVIVVLLVILLTPGGYHGQTPDLWILIPTLFFVTYGAYMFMVMPQTIEINQDTNIKFSSLWQQNIIDINELKEISTESSGYYVIFKFDNNKFKILNRIDGLYELVAFLKLKKTDLRVKGL